MTRESDPFASPRALTAEDVAGASGCLHRWYLDCHAEPDSRESAPAGDRQEDAFKRHCLSWLPDVREPSWGSGDEGRLDTIQLLEDGHAWIYRGVLARDGMTGRPDLLQRVEGRSALGPFSYVPAKVKSRTGPPETADLRELQFHALLLEPLLGKLPTQGWIYGPDGRSTELDLRTAWGSFTTLVEDLLRIRRGELMTEGYRCPACRRCPWTGACRKVWTQLSHVCLLPGMDQADVAAFRDRGFASWTAIAASPPERLSRRLGLSLDRARLLWLHAKAFQSGRPVMIGSAPFPKDLPIHFYMPEFRNGRCYLHGVYRIQGAEVRIRQFLASAPTLEGATWHAFLDDLARDPRALVFSWSDRASKPLEMLWKRHGGNADGWRHLTRGRRSLHRFLREQVILPLSDYNLRDVAAYFSFKWSRASESDRPLFPLPWQREDDLPRVDASRQLLDANRERISAMKSIYFGLQRLQQFGLTG
jgi:predicted RecB family nuclease